MSGMPTDGGLVTSVTPTTALGLSSVWRCLDILQNGVSQLPWSERYGNLELPSSRIVERPQAARTRREWTSLVVSTLALYDVCYLLKVGQDNEGMPLGLWYLDPSIVSPMSVNLFDVNYLLPPEYFQVGGQRMHRDQLVILHRGPQPTVADQLGGLMNLARTMFGAALAADRYASRYWQSGGSPTNVLETDQKLPLTVKADLSDAWRARKAQGPDYAPVLDGGIKARSFGADPTAEAAVEARKEQVADIGRYFGIPTRILNAPAGDTETYNTSEAGNQDLVRYTLQNYIGAIQDAITDQLPGIRRMVMETGQLTFGTQLARAQAYQLASGNKPFMTVGEIRDQLGLGPVENAADLAPVPKAAAPAGGLNG